MDLRPQQLTLIKATFLSLIDSSRLFTWTFNLRCNNHSIHWNSTLFHSLSHLIISVKQGRGMLQAASHLRSKMYIFSFFHFFRYSSESYMYRRGNPRQGFGGNYQRQTSNPTEEISNTPRSQGPRSLSTSTIPDPQHLISPRPLETSVDPPRNETIIQTPAKVTITKKVRSMSVQQPLPQPNPPHVGPIMDYNVNHQGDVMSNGLSQVAMETKPPSPPHVRQNEFVHPQCSPSHSPSQRSPIHTRQSSNSEDMAEQEVIPSVNEVIANIEGHHSQTSPPSQKKHVGRSRVAELRETILRKSNENLHESSLSRSRENISRSQESLSRISPASSSEKLSTAKSHDRLHHVTPPSTSPLPSPNSHHTRSKSSPVPLKNCLSEANHEGSQSDNESMQAFESCHVSQQKSLEEIAYEEQAAIVASQLKEEDKHLSEVILPPAQHKKTTDFITGLFDTRLNKVGRRPSLLTRYVSPQNEPPMENHSDDSG